MFILSWVAIQVLEANSIIIPAFVGVTVAWLAVLEVLIYVLILALNLFVIFRGR